jgi:alkanesulfonate monooxygenase SsuD/methylene tetrahydromethanopterin reductase-like flavin-dependent oxidoreductase (luciferase family)
VRFGLLVPQYGCSIDATLAVARAADAAALDIWIAGQLFPISSRLQGDAFEPLTLMAAIAARTTRSRLGFMVLAAPYLPPFSLAKAIITLDHLSGGRLDAGLGAGWRAEEFAAVEQPFGTFSTRVRALARAIDVLEALAAGEERVEQAFPPPAGPPSVQRPRPPLWIAGRGAKMTEFVGRHADWANFARGISGEEFAAAGQRVHESALAAGRGESAVQLSLTGTFLSGTRDRVESVLRDRASERGLDVADYRRQLRAANAFVGSPGEVLEQLEPYQATGCRAVILWPLDGDYRAAAAALSAVSDLAQDAPPNTPAGFQQKGTE